MLGSISGGWSPCPWAPFGGPTRCFWAGASRGWYARARGTPCNITLGVTPTAGPRRQPKLCSSPRAGPAGGSGGTTGKREQPLPSRQPGTPGNTAAVLIFARFATEAVTSVSPAAAAHGRCASYVATVILLRLLVLL